MLLQSAMKASVYGSPITQSPIITVRRWILFLHLFPRSLLQQNTNIVISRFLKRYLKAKSTSLFTRAATNQREVFQRRPREAQVRFPEYHERTEELFKVGVVQMGRVNDQVFSSSCYQYQTIQKHISCNKGLNC